jgi:hypothetical protein
MGTPLEHYKPIDLGARKDEDLNRSPETYFWAVFTTSVGFIIGLSYYLPSPYAGIVRGIAIISFLAILITALVRLVPRSR